MLKTINGGKMPEKGSKYSACIDLFANEDVTIGAGETKLVGLGVCIDIKNSMGRKLNAGIGIYGLETFEERIEAFKNSHYLQLMLRSSLGKKGLILPNGVGIIDLDYKDEIKMIIHNPFTLKTVANVAIDYANRTIEALSNITFKFSSLKIKKDGFNIDGSFSIYKKDLNKKIKASKIAQITLLEHKGYLFGVETDKERDGGFGSTD